MSDDDRELSDHITREELHDALRFVYMMGMQGREQVDRIDAVLAALVGVLLDSGQLDPSRVDALLPQATARLRSRNIGELTVDVAPASDKYAMQSPSGLDCETLLPLCQARCCRLTFALSFQDLEEGTVQWNYSIPYRIRQASDAHCVHLDRESRGCGVYERRPGVCRVYDCRNDKRIWSDFDNRVLAPLDMIRPADKLYDIRRPVRDGASRMDDPSRD